MSYTRDRDLATINRRLDMMIAKGTLATTTDNGGVQTNQVTVLADEVLDGVERFQSFGLSAVPPNGSEVLLVCLQGNRDQTHIIGVNHRGSRPKGLNPGEVVLYNDKNCHVALSQDGDIMIGNPNASITLAEDGTITLKGTSIRIDTPAKSFDLETHKHLDVQPGAGTSGEPEPS